MTGYHEPFRRIRWRSQRYRHCTVAIYVGRLDIFGWRDGLMAIEIVIDPASRECARLDFHDHHHWIPVLIVAGHRSIVSGVSGIR